MDGISDHSYNSFHVSLKARGVWSAVVVFQRRKGENDRHLLANDCR
jgi:hypothetical protein